MAKISYYAFFCLRALTCGWYIFANFAKFRFFVLLLFLADSSSRLASCLFCFYSLSFLTIKLFNYTFNA